MQAFAVYRPTIAQKPCSTKSNNYETKDDEFFIVFCLVYMN